MPVRITLEHTVVLFQTELVGVEELGERGEETLLATPPWPADSLKLSRHVAPAQKQKSQDWISAFPNRARMSGRVRS